MEQQNVTPQETTKNDGYTALNIISWLFGSLAFAIGIVNTFWGKPAGFGVFIILLSFAYFLPVNAILKKITSLSIPKTGLRIMKVLLALFILWAALGVGELFNKIEVMLNDF